MTYSLRAVRNDKPNAGRSASPFVYAGDEICWIIAANVVTRSLVFKVDRSPRPRSIAPASDLLSDSVERVQNAPGSSNHAHTETADLPPKSKTGNELAYRALVCLENDV